MSTRGKCKRPLKKMTVNSENRGQNASLRSRRGSISGILRRLLYKQREAALAETSSFKTHRCMRLWRELCPQFKTTGFGSCSNF